jgi:hypothetical protein
LTESQKSRARKNIGAISSDETAAGYVNYNASQSLTDTQKSQARANVGLGNFNGTYASLSGKPTIPDAQVQSDWSISDTTNKGYILNRPCYEDHTHTYLPVSGYTASTEVTGHAGFYVGTKSNAINLDVGSTYYIKSLGTHSVCREYRYIHSPGYYPVEVLGNPKLLVDILNIFDS